MTNFFTLCISTILRVVYKVLPQHTKRLVLWCTLYIKLCGSKSLTKEEATKMGERLISVLPIAKDATACILPFLFARFTPKELNKSIEVMRQSMKREMPCEINLSEFVKSIPVWMQYASDTFIGQDFATVICTHHTVRA